MYLSSVTLAGVSLATLALATQGKDLGYMKCATAVVEDLSFPGCTSSYKLDCFCQSVDKEATAKRLSADAQEVCTQNGVPPSDLAKYLCNDDNVPASPRKGSSPMVRLGDAETDDDDDDDYDDDDHEHEHEHNHEEEEGEGEEEEGEGGEEERDIEKRAFQPDVTTRLLIPQNTNTNTNTNDSDSDSDDEDNEDTQTRTTPVYQVLTVTETECACEETESTEVANMESTPIPVPVPVSAPASIPTSTAVLRTETETETDTDTDTESATETESQTALKHHGSLVVAAATSTPAVRKPSVSSVIVVVSSSVPGVLTPTGVDASREHGVNQGVVFEGGSAHARAFGIVGGMMGVLGVMAGVVLL